MHRAGQQSAPPRPLLVIAALLAALGLLTMHTLMATPVAANTAALSASAHAKAGADPAESLDHEHTHADHSGAPHSPHSSQTPAHATSDIGSNSTGQPCTSCPGCDHDSTSVCALTPAKAGTSHLLLSVTDLAPAPHQLASWPSAGTNSPQAEPAPPSLIDLSISRT